MEQIIHVSTPTWTDEVLWWLFLSALLFAIGCYDILKNRKPRQRSLFIDKNGQRLWNPEFPWSRLRYYAVLGVTAAMLLIGFARSVASPDVLTVGLNADTLTVTYEKSREPLNIDRRVIVMVREYSKPRGGFGRGLEFVTASGTTHKSGYLPASVRDTVVSWTGLRQVPSTGKYQRWERGK